MKFQHIKDEKSGEIQLIENGKRIGEISYDILEDGSLSAYHTGVDPEQQGRGLGYKLLNHLVEYARENNKKIVPVCSFVVRNFEINPKIHDVLK